MYITTKHSSSHQVGIFIPYNVKRSSNHILQQYTHSLNHTLLLPCPVVNTLHLLHSNPMQFPLHLIRQMLRRINSQQAPDDSDSPKAQRRKIHRLERLAVRRGHRACNSSEDGRVDARGLGDGAGCHGGENGRDIGGGETGGDGGAADEGGQSGGEAIGEDGGVDCYGDGAACFAVSNVKRSEAYAELECDGMGEDVPAARIDASIPDDTPISSGLQNSGASESAASSMKPTKKGPMMVNAMPLPFVAGVSDAHDDTKATMPKAERMSQYRVLPKNFMSPPAAIWPSAVAAETVHCQTI